ncbi:RagB/SusD family nutrient uptake outer membrane protein [Chitinophaga sp. SYP-B3965]|uniref:RagB/SusD family nutrient uptake outer membrane protein n=1 Tax=Chitinophaga sp. SYP-B3965 TaxID=2663120 RepID=UPI001299B7F7|nr:RagB/SusD family nutrient uptake outer membrane protein [Chitinophaga sp. SYP-B3965]MRG45522.1 RagB/SusD family nutrient uptake outer membrane protein [Chitinophaga sp. SYP-B3965]
MKKQLIIFSFIALLASACGDAFLDVEPTDRFTNDTYWKNREHAEAALNATYAVLLEDGIYGNNVSVMYETASPNAYNYNNNNGFNNLAQGVHDAANTAVVNNTWRNAYLGIGRANTLLARIDGVSMDSTLKRRFKAEAKFLRAVFYFPLWNLYQGAPLILEEPDYAKQASLPRNDTNSIKAQIIKDLDEAAADLPLSFTGTDKGRATKGAALAFKAKVLLYAGEWEAAANAAKAVIDAKTYTLYPDYRALFYLENEGNQEVIFDAQFKFPEFTHGMDIALDEFNTVAPLPNVVDDYYAKDGLPISQSPLYNPAKPYENRDPRLTATYTVIGSNYKGAVVKEGQYPRTGYGQKKYTIYKDDIKPAITLAAGQSELNYIVLRYADVLLMFAEAQNEAFGPGPLIDDALHKIRFRAGMPDITAGLGKDALRAEIRHERRIELAGEGLYYFDIRRWRTAEKEMNTDIYNYKTQRIDTRRFNAQRDYRWPVPSVAIQENPKLEQNPQYGK